MCKWSERPRGRSKRRAWLRRFISVQTARLKQGFVEAWYRKHHFTPDSQRKACEAKIAKARRELEALTAA
jgi:hypothetical protein